MDERRLKSISNAAESLNELNEAIEKSENLLEKAQLKLLKATLEAELQEAFNELLEEIMDGHPEEAELLKQRIIDNPQKMMELFRDFLKGLESPEKNSEEFISGLPEELRKNIEQILQNPPDSKRNYVLDSPFLKKLNRPKEKANEKIEDIKISKYDNNSVTINSGYMDGIERSYLEAIAKFCFDGQITQDGRPFMTLGQLYRALRGGIDQSPTKAQKEGMLAVLNEMERPERKIDFEFKQAVSINNEIEHTGGRRRIISFDEDRVKIRGQSDTVIVFEKTPYFVALTKEYKMYESMPQEFKQVKADNWILYLENGKTIKGLERYCKRKLKNQKILKTEKTFKPLKLSDPRIALRDNIQNRIWHYMRARGAKPPQPCSNQINYEDLFELCGIGKDPNQKENAIDFIFAVMEDLQRNGVVSRWQEYQNIGDKKTSGIEFYVNSNNIMLGEKE